MPKVNANMGEHYFIGVLAGYHDASYMNGPIIGMVGRFDKRGHLALLRGGDRAVLLSFQEK